MVNSSKRFKGPKQKCLKMNYIDPLNNFSNSEINFIDFAIFSIVAKIIVSKILLSLQQCCNKSKSNSTWVLTLWPDQKPLIAVDFFLPSCIEFIAKDVWPCHPCTLPLPHFPANAGRWAAAPPWKTDPIMAWTKKRTSAELGLPLVYISSIKLSF